MKAPFEKERGLLRLEFLQLTGEFLAVFAGRELSVFFEGEAQVGAIAVAAFEGDGFDFGVGLSEHAFGVVEADASEFCSWGAAEVFLEGFFETSLGHFDGFGNLFKSEAVAEIRAHNLEGFGDFRVGYGEGF